MTQDRVKAKLFEPDHNGEVSVFLTATWTQESRIDCGRAVAREREKKSLYGWALLEAAAVPEDEDPTKNLTVVEDNTPPGHANICNWPDDPDDVLSWQEKLAKHSKSVLLQPPVDA